VSKRPDPYGEYVTEISELNNELEQEIVSYHNTVNNQIYSVEAKIAEYRVLSRKGDGYISDMNSKISDLQQLKNDLNQHKQDLARLSSEIDALEKEFEEMGRLDTNILLNPIVMRSKQVYMPEWENGESGDTSLNVGTVMKGFNLISLQTIFPTILSLITLFLALLISSFVTLSEINSSANYRLRMVKDLLLPEFGSIYFSSLLLTIIPVMMVLVLGQFLFRLPIFNNFGLVFLPLFFLMSIFIFTGMSLAYLIKKESMTLLVSTFLLVFSISYSGFILAVERMSDAARAVALIFPGRLALMAFNKIVFYQVNLWSVWNDLTVLFIWFVMIGAIALVIKMFKS